MDPELKKLKKTITELNRDDNESVLGVQKSINEYTSSIGMYPERDLLKEDGMYGGRTHGRIAKVLEFYNDRLQDSVFDSQESKRADFFRDWIWTQPEDTLGVQGAKHYKSNKMLKSKIKDYNKGGN
jgi:CRISPR/Cas system-associated endoribonuclease Cas2